MERRSLHIFFLESDHEHFTTEIRSLEEEEKRLLATDAHVYIISKVQNRLKCLRRMLSAASIVLPAHDGITGIGSVVRATCFVGKGHERRRRYEEHGVAIYEIGSYLVPSGKLFRISYDSVTGRALLGSSVGQTRNVSLGSIDVGGGKTLVDFNLQVSEITPA